MLYSASLSSMTDTSLFSIKELKPRIELQGSTVAVEILGEGVTVNVILVFLPQSAVSLSARSEVKPEPVPPPTEWKIMNPCRLVHWSAIFRTLSRHNSDMSLPTVYLPLPKLLAASSLPEMRYSGWNICLYLLVLISSMTVGSRSIMMDLGTYWPLQVSLKKVPCDSSSTLVLMESLSFSLQNSPCLRPLGWMPCSRLKSYHMAFPVWMPAWPTCRQIISLIGWMILVFIKRSQLLTIQRVQELQQVHDDRELFFNNFLIDSDIHFRPYFIQNREYIIKWEVQCVRI